MKNIIIVKPDKCVGCNACIRSCPASDANIVKKIDGKKTIVNVNTPKCIACGRCIETCPHGARDYVDDTEYFMSHIPDEKVAIIVDPSIKAALPNKWKDILNWFKKKDCLIFDGAYGSEIYAWALMKAMETSKTDNVVSQHCAAVSTYVKIYQPELQKKLSPIYSPSICMAIYIKNNLRRNNKVAVLSSCIAKKLEQSDANQVDFNLTFKKVMEYFDKNDIVIPSVNYDDMDYSFDDDKIGLMGALISRPGGLCDNILYNNPDANTAYSSDCTKVFPELKTYAKMPNVNLPSVFDVLSCTYGCSMGPGAGTSCNSFEVNSYMRRMELNVQDKLNKNKGMFRTGDDKLFKKFDEELKLEDFIKPNKTLKPFADPKPEVLSPIFKEMNKTTNTERNYNCGACGYKTCNDLAIAIYKKLASPEACIRQHGNNSKSTLDSKTSKQLAERIKSLTTDINELSASNTRVAEKMKSVNELLKNMADFCNKNSAIIDENNIKQLARVIEATIKSLGTFDSGSEMIKKKTEAVDKTISEILGMFSTDF